VVHGGQLGNDAVSVRGNLVEYSYLPTYAITPSGYVINNQVATAYHETRNTQSGYTWEVANNYNIGLDVLYGITR
jgi:hypothetical protein